MKKLKHILKSRYLFKILVFITLIASIIYTNYPHTSKYNIDDNKFTGIVKDYKIADNKLTINLLAKEEIIIEYKYNNASSINLSYGDKILVRGKIKEPNENVIFNNFNYKKYLYYQKIYFIVEAESIDKIANNQKISYIIKNTLYDRVAKLKSSNYIKAILFGDNKLAKEVKESYRINGISHLFSVSGFHINFFISIIYLYLDKISYNKKLKHIIINIFLVLYLIIFNSPSLYRAVIMNIVFSINFLAHLNIKKIDLLLLTLIICLIINPFIIYNIGFIYSYIISFFLIIFQIKTNKKVIKSLYTILIAFIVSFPITIFNSYEVNILSILINILIVPIISIIILPLSIITLIFPIFDLVLYWITNLLEVISLSISKITIFKINLCKPSILLIISYYLIMIFILIKKKYYYLFIVLVIIHSLIPYFNSSLEVTMFDVGEADAMLVSYPNNSFNILIDTGRGYDIQNIITYLKSMGINTLDYLIITHGDSDHIGGAEYLIDNFKVNNVILNRGDYSTLESNLIIKLNKYEIAYTSDIEKIGKRNIYLYFLNNKDFNNENDNSIITYFKYQEYQFLLMGDASETTEKYLLENYHLHNISFLKVGHHGSSTSSSEKFINSINPKYSLISVGKNNRYDHPKTSVLNILSNSEIYRTDQDGSVMFKIKDSKLKIETCVP